MGKLKFNKKHLFSFVVVIVLLFSLNLNTFATPISISIHFADTDYLCSDSNGDCTDDVSCSSRWVDVDGDADVDCLGSTFYFPSSSIGLEKAISCSVDLDLYSNSLYEFSFYLWPGYKSSDYSEVCAFILYYVDGEFYTSDVFFEETVSNGQWTFIEGEYETPDLSGDLSYTLVFAFNQYDSSSTSSSLRITLGDLDLTYLGESSGGSSGGSGGSGDDSGGSNPITPGTDSELKDTVDRILTGTPITTPPTDELQNSINEYENVMNELPQVDGDELDHLMRFDFESFTDGMDFVREVFEITMGISGFNSILVFALTIGLATYIIGRKVG